MSGPRSWRCAGMRPSLMSSSPPCCTGCACAPAGSLCFRPTHQLLPSSQLRGKPPVHTALAHTPEPLTWHSVGVHDSVFGACTHVPATHVSFVHGLPSSQFMAEPAQAPNAQRSPTVHALPSLHAPVLFTVTQPVEAPHEVVWHTLPVVGQVIVAPAHTPPLQTSLAVHSDPSLQLCPSLVGEYTQAPVCALHASAVLSTHTQVHTHTNASAVH